jgi:hypothetical protein
MFRRGGGSVADLSAQLNSLQAALMRAKMFHLAQTRGQGKHM